MGRGVGVVVVNVLRQLGICGFFLPPAHSCPTHSWVEVDGAAGRGSPSGYTLPFCCRVRRRWLDCRLRTRYCLINSLNRFWLANLRADLRAPVKPPNLFCSCFCSISPASSMPGSVSFCAWNRLLMRGILFRCISEALGW